MLKMIKNVVTAAPKMALSVLGDPLGSNAINSGLDAQGRATAEANAVLGNIYNQQREDLSHYKAAGQNALSGLANPDLQRDFTAADFERDPGYDFRMQEGMKALERSAAAKGGLQSGGTLKALTRYNQDFASNEFQNARNNFNANRESRFNRLSSIAGMGQNAVGQSVNAAGNYGAAMSQNITGMGNAQAAAGMAKANANQQMLSGLIRGGAAVAGGGA
jgi:hypothetical protein